MWELAEQRSLYIEHRPERAGHAMHTIIVDDFDASLARIADRGLEPTEPETYSNGVRKAIYRDPDGNEIGFGGIPTLSGPSRAAYPLSSRNSWPGCRRPASR